MSEAPSCPTTPARSTRAQKPALAAAIQKRIARYDWRGLEGELDARGFARLPELLSPVECEALVALYPQRQHFRNFVDMEAHRFGRGDYRYFDRPLPAIVRALQTHLYRRLAPIANRWSERLGEAQRFPAALAGLRERCAAAGQSKPTPLLLRYEAEGFNCLHQDLYGEIAFPLQVACLLSPSGEEQRDAAFAGGEFLLSEQRPRQQSRCDAIRLSLGEGLVFPTRERPVTGARGEYRARMKHGVSRLHSGRRFTLGIIFHDAR